MEVSRGRLYFTVGLPRSGKTTHCDSWVRRYQEREGAQFRVLHKTDGLPMPSVVHLDSAPRAIVGGDDFRTALHGEAYIYEAEHHVFAAMDLTARALLNRGFDVIMDETCTTETTLLRYLRIDPFAEAVFIDTPKEVCIQRALDSGRPYLVHPIECMAEQLYKLRPNWDDRVQELQTYLRKRYPFVYKAA